jgi:hypothetical protein
MSAHNADVTLWQIVEVCRLRQGKNIGFKGQESYGQAETAFEDRNPCMHQNGFPLFIGVYFRFNS